MVGRSISTKLLLFSFNCQCSNPCVHSSHNNINFPLSQIILLIRINSVSTFIARKWLEHHFQFNRSERLRLAIWRLETEKKKDDELNNEKSV